MMNRLLAEFEAPKEFLNTVESPPFDCINFVDPMVIAGNRTFETPFVSIRLEEIVTWGIWNDN